MDIKHKIGGDMRILLNPEDVGRLKRHNLCESVTNVDGVSLRTSIIRDEFTTEPIAQIDGHSVQVYLPEGDAVLPLDIEVDRMMPAARFYFGETGKICLIGQVEI